MSGYLSGEKVPKYALRIAIELWTGGEIERSEWETEAEREKINKVVPFVRTGTEN